MVSLDFNWPDIPNPFDYLGSAAGKVIADGWTAAMLGLWSAGLWVLRLVLNIMDAFLTPDISEDGPVAQVYRTTFWIAGVLALTLCMLQLGVAAFRRDGRSLATVMIGVGQFGIVWAAWIAYGVGAESAACSPVQLALRASTFSAAVEPHAGRFLVLGRLVATASIHLGSDRQFAATPLRACETSVAPLMNSSSRYPQAARLGKRRHQLVWLDGLDRYRVRT